MCRYKHTTNPSVTPPYQNEDWEIHDLKEFSTGCRYRINQPNKSTLNSTPCQTQPISVKLVFKPLVETFDSTLVLQASLFLLLYKTRENTGGKMIMPSSKCQLPLPLIATHYVLINVSAYCSTLKYIHICKKSLHVR